VVTPIKLGEESDIVDVSDISDVSVIIDFALSQKKDLIAGILTSSEDATIRYPGSRYSFHNPMPGRKEKTYQA